VTPDLRPYVVLLAALLGGRLNADEFQAVLVALFKNDQLRRPQEVYEVLNSIFLTTEAYDPANASAPYAVQEQELIDAAATALKHLEEVVNPG
jgi:hypothetical protein